MAKVFKVALLELRPGVEEQEFIKFFIEQYAPLYPRLGMKGYVLKADRGERTGKFAMIEEFPSVEQRNHFLSEPEELTEEALRLLGPEFDEIGKKLDTYVTGWSSTDYIVQGK